MSENKNKTEYPIVKSVFAAFSALSLLAAFSVQSATAREIRPSNVIELVNEARQLQGMDALSENEKLSQAAQDKADDMVAENYFAHISPKGVTPWRWLEERGYDYRYAGENLAINFTDAESQQAAWMKSESHRRNILNGNYAEIGAGVKKGVIDGRESIVTVQMFGLEAGKPVPANTGKGGGEKAVLAASNKKDAAYPGTGETKNIWMAIAAVLIGSIIGDFILINRKYHHKTVLIAHH